MGTGLLSRSKAGIPASDVAQPQVKPQTVANMFIEGVRHAQKAISCRHRRRFLPPSQMLSLLNWELALSRSQRSGEVQNETNCI